MDAQQAEALMWEWGEEMIERGRQQGLERGLERGLEQGRRQERAEGVLRILSERGVQATEEARQRILACTDMATLDHWFKRALNATTLSDVLDAPAS